MSDPNPNADLTIAGLVHDLNNVFETISEGAELLADDDNWTPVAAAILRSVERGRRIVGGYADRTRTGPDLEVVVDRAALFLQDFLRHLPGRKVKVVKRFESGISLQGAAGDWERVFMNLFLNAAQAMTEGGSAIEVECARNPESLEVRVSDDGPGIPEALLGKIFQSRVSTKSNTGGLGLHIVRTLVQGNGGKVRAANREGANGAVFTITLPQAVPDPQSLPAGD